MKYQAKQEHWLRHVSNENKEQAITQKMNYNLETSAQK
jgi:hypothetical protein